jgi:hypothetical protein
MFLNINILNMKTETMLQQKKKWDYIILLCENEPSIIKLTINRKKAKL